MPFRAPKNFWEWLLLCSPALVIWAGTAIAAVMPGENEGGLLGGLLGCFAAGFISLLVGFVLAAPNPRRAIRTVWILIVGCTVAILNFAIAFAGCGLVMR
ncbi:MAG: hypothetical protein ABIP20_08900 [Chthoniobacteraceae bacterium]